MKILFISSDKFPPFRVDVSVLFAKEIVGRGHTIDWLLQSDKPVHRAYETQWCGSKVLVGRAAKRNSSVTSKTKNHVYAALHDLKAFHLLGKEKYDFTIVKDKFISGLVGVGASRFKGSKLVYWLSYPFPEAALFRVKDGTAAYPVLYWIKGHVFKFILYKILLPCSDHIFVQTEHMKSNIAKKGVPKEKMTAVPMAVSAKEIPFFEYKISRVPNKKKKSVVYLGTLMKIRKMDFLLRAFARVLDKDSNARLYLVGGGEHPSDEKLLRDEARRLRIDHAVSMTGFLPRNEAWQYVKASDVCVSPINPVPILNCGSPTKLLEYMAMGKAVVANDHPEQRQVLLESRAGICVPYREDAFAEAILYLLKNPDITRKMGLRGRRYIEKKRNYESTAELVESKLLDLYRI